MAVPFKSKGKLFWRLFQAGVVVLVLFSATSIAVGVFLHPKLFMRRDPSLSPSQRQANFIAKLCANDWDSPEELKATIADAEPLGIAVRVFDANGAIVAQVDRAQRPSGSKLVDNLTTAPIVVEGRKVGVVQIRFTTPVFRFPPPHVFIQLAVTAAITFIAIVVLSFLLARALSNPVVKLTRAVRAFGKGDLGARARLKRRDELGELSDEFDEMADRLSGLILSEKELLANVSHELRTPLSTVRLALELAEGKASTDVKPYLKDIEQSSREMESLVNDLLFAASLDLATAMPGETGELVAAPVTVTPAALVEEAERRFKQRHHTRPLHVEVASSLPELTVDPKLLRRLLDNLLENANKYSDAQNPITLAARSEPGSVLLEVRDKGIGIDPRDMEHLFKPLFRTDRSRARGTGGVGLGLHIARKIADAHEAKLEVHSQVGVGTTIRLRLPLPARAS